jgi:phosphotriesterase-related protein
LRGDELAVAHVKLLDAQTRRTGSGAPSDTFVWIHAHVEPDITIHHELARRGAWIEYDGIGEPADDERFIDLVLRGLDAGLGHRLLLSMDRGWYDPAQPGGGTPKPFTALSERFLPKLADAGVDDTMIDRLARRNPFDAFARPGA